MATLTRVGDSGKPCRRLPISSANVIIPPLDNIEISNKAALWNTLEDISTKHGTWGQIVKPTVSEEDGSSTKEDHKGNVVFSDKEESSDDVYTLNLLTECKHRDGSIYRGIDTCWKKEYRIVDRRESIPVFCHAKVGLQEAESLSNSPESVKRNNLIAIYL